MISHVIVLIVLLDYDCDRPQARHSTASFRWTE